MFEKKIQIKDFEGNLLFPKTKASVVINNDGFHLGKVEAGAQVNKIERILVNGQEISIVDKTVAITTPEEAEYSISKLESAQSGYSATYQLTKNGAKVGDFINIPKDMFVQSGSVKTCEEANSPQTGFVVGDKYIDLLLANTDNQHIYIKVTDLIDTYTAGDGIVVSNNQISIDTSVVATKTDLTAKQDALSQAQLNAINSGITADKVTAYDGYATTIAGKADKATTLAGYGITDAVSTTMFNNSNLLTYDVIVNEGISNEDLSDLFG